MFLIVVVVKVILLVCFIIEIDNLQYYMHFPLIIACLHQTLSIDQVIYNSYDLQEIIATFQMCMRKTSSVIFKQMVSKLIWWLVEQLPVYQCTGPCNAFLYRVSLNIHYSTL